MKKALIVCDCISRIIDAFVLVFLFSMFFVDYSKAVKIIVLCILLLGAVVLPLFVKIMSKRTNNSDHSNKESSI